MKHPLDLPWRTTDELRGVWTEAAQAAFQAGGIIRKHWNRSFNVRKKGAIDLVSEVDLAAEEAILARLRLAYPDDGIVAEESGRHTGGSGRVWHVDPLDGTTNFSHGLPHFSVSIAAEKEGETIVGIVYQPIQNWLFSAIKGAGAYWNTSPMNVSRTNELSQALLATGFPYDRTTNPNNNVPAFARLLSHSQGIRRGGSAALDLAYIANGWLDGYWEIRLNSWDVAAGWLLVSEAGGTLSAIDDAQRPPSARGFVVSNGRIHQELINHLAPTSQASIEG